MTTLAITTHTGGRLAELAFLLIAIAGASMFLVQVPLVGRAKNSLAGMCLCAAGVLLIVAVHWAHWG